MISLMAWRNIWRSRTRTWVVIGAIALGIWAALFMSGFATGLMNSYISNAISQIVSHIQVHHPDFKQDRDVKYRIPDPDQVADFLRTRPAVQAVSVRSLSNGMIASSQATRGVQINGVVPESERAIRQLDQMVVDGAYFDEGKSNQILVGRRLAEKLKVDVRKKVVLTFQDLDGNITAAAFRIVGLFKSQNKPFDESQVFVLREDLNRLLEAADSSSYDGPIAHEIAVLLDDTESVDTATSQWAGVYPGLMVESYREISPDLQLYESQMKYVSLIYLTVIMLALLFGIINTMLMAVLERYRELGMLMAIGMNKRKVFLMIVLETILLCMVAAPLGLLLGWGTISYFGTNGLDLSAYGNSMEQFGMSTIAYFSVNPAVYWQVPIGVAITALLGAVYPAWKAIRLRPVEAIRKL